MLSLQQLVTPVSEDEALQTILDTLTQAGLQVTSWQSGSVQLLILRLFARIWSKLTSTIALIAAGGFTTLAATTPGGSPFLRLLAKFFYSIDYLAASPTIGQIVLTSSAAAPPLTFAAGDIIIADAPHGTNGAHSYTCTAGTTLSPGNSVTIQFQADVAGAGANIAPGTTLYLWTPLVGITATNPVVAGTNTWITTPGQDDESDGRLLARCIGRWSRLTYGNTDGAYLGWALEALPALTRVQIASSPGNGTVGIIGATALGAIDAGQITTIANYLNGVSDGRGRRPTNDIINVSGATVVTTPALTVDAFVLSEIADTAGPAIAAALISFCGTQPIGGLKLYGSQGVVQFDDLLDTAKRALPGIRKVALNISADVDLSDGQIYAPTVTVNVHQVAPPGR